MAFYIDFIIKNFEFKLKNLGILIRVLTLLGGYSNFRDKSFRRLRLDFEVRKLM